MRLDTDDCYGDPDCISMTQFDKRERLRIWCWRHGPSPSTSSTSCSLLHQTASKSREASMPPSSPWPSYPPISPSLASWTGKLFKAGHWSTASSNCFLATISLTSWPTQLGPSMIGTSSYPTSQSSLRRSLPRSIFTKPITSDLFCAISDELYFMLYNVRAFELKIALASYFKNLSYL